MVWEECVNHIKQTWDTNAKEANEVNWSTISQNDMESDIFATGKPFSLICPSRHCVEGAEQSPSAHRICRCEDVNGKPVGDCNPKDYLYPFSSIACINISNPADVSQKRGRSCTNQGNTYYPLTCYCCCSCFAHGTRIGVPNGFKVIEQFQVGDRVLTADVEPSGTGVKLNWSTAKVTFSNGTGPDSHQAAMVYIHHGETGIIIVTPDHLFLMPNGKLKRADRLVPGVDYLVSSEGQPVAINEVSIGEYTGGVHHIATNKEFTGDLNGHLLISEGVVSGDFNLQIHAAQLKESHFVDDHDNLPKVGTPQYEAQNADLVRGTYAAFQTPEKASRSTASVSKLQKFYVHGERTASIPETAAKYLSSLQEIDVNDNAEKLGFSEVGLVSAVVKYVLKLFRGFYSDIVFYHDIGRLQPNAYAFTQYGNRIIVLSGGLTRIKGLGMEGLALILSHLITRLQKSEPLDDNGYTSVTMADYYSTAVLRNVFFETLYPRIYKDGLKQLEDTIFSNISDANNQYEEDPYRPTKETRLDAIDAGNAMDYPPAGIGGPTRNGLQVTGSEALPPELTPAALVTEDITPETSELVYKTLQQHKVLDEQGVLAADFGLDTDLSFLFADQPENL